MRKCFNNISFLSNVSFFSRNSFSSYISSIRVKCGCYTVFLHNTLWNIFFFFYLQSSKQTSKRIKEFSFTKKKKQLKKLTRSSHIILNIFFPFPFLPNKKKKVIIIFRVRGWDKLCKMEIYFLPYFSTHRRVPEIFFFFSFSTRFFLHHTYNIRRSLWSKRRRKKNVEFINFLAAHDIYQKLLRFHFSALSKLSSSSYKQKKNRIVIYMRKLGN